MIEDLKVRYFGFWNPSGYCNAAKGYLRAMAELGIKPPNVRCAAAVGASPQASDRDDDPWLREYFSQAQWDGQRWVDQSEPIDKALNVVHIHPTFAPRYWTQGWYNLAICAWETDSLPKGRARNADDELVTLAEGLNRFDEIWVPSNLALQALVNSGVKEELIQLVPHALLPEQLQRPLPGPWPEIAERNPGITPGRKIPGEPVRFYFIGSWDERKNTSELLQAYIATGWDISTPVELVLHCVPATRDRLAVETHGWNAQEEATRIRSSASDPTSLPSWGLHVLPRSAEWIWRMHERGHVFITASCGEGFGLPALEAMACGNLVVSTRLACHAYGPDVSVPFRPEPVRPMPHVAGYELGQKWWRPDFDGLTEGFKKAFDMVRGRSHDRTQRAQAVRTEYSPAAVAERIRPRLERIAGILAERGW